MLSLLFAVPRLHAPAFVYDFESDVERGKKHDVSFAIAINRRTNEELCFEGDGALKKFCIYYKDGHKT